jgi:3',5'-cyclic AMP phosphodiesterase CpdA
MTVRLAHVSDIHFGGEHVDAVEAVLGAVDAFAPDLVLATGDLTLNGLPKEFMAAKAWLARLPRPLLVTPGNHDTPYWNLILRTFTPFARYERYIGPHELTAHDAPGLCARALNSARGFQLQPDWSKGVADLGDVARVAEDMAAHPDALKVFACHHPLIDPPGAPVTGGVRRGDRAVACLTRAGVDLILTGHTHMPFALALDKSDRLVYAIGAGTLSLRTRGTPPSFTTILTDAAHHDVTVLGWTGSNFEPIDHWLLPRSGTQNGPD